MVYENCHTATLLRECGLEVTYLFLDLAINTSEGRPLKHFFP